MFDVGDLIRGLKGNPGRYGVTTDRMTLGVVTEVYNRKTIRVKVLEHKNMRETGLSFDVRAEHFELAIDVTKENAFDLYISGQISEERYLKETIET